MLEGPKMTKKNNPKILDQVQGVSCNMTRVRLESKISLPEVTIIICIVRQLITTMELLTSIGTAILDSEQGLHAWLVAPAVKASSSTPLSPHEVSKTHTFAAAQDVPVSPPRLGGNAVFWASSDWRRASSSEEVAQPRASLGQDGAHPPKSVLRRPCSQTKRPTSPDRVSFSRRLEIGPTSSRSVSPVASEGASAATLARMHANQARRAASQRNSEEAYKPMFMVM